MVHCSAVSLFRRRYKGLMRPMVLKSRVRSSSKTNSSPPCLAEMTALMACWKLHSFSDVPCQKEIATFNTCANEMRTNPKSQSLQSGEGLSPEHINTQLRKFAWPQ